MTDFFGITDSDEEEIGSGGLLNEYDSIILNTNFDKLVCELADAEHKHGEVERTIKKAIDTALINQLGRSYAQLMNEIKAEKDKATLLRDQLQEQSNRYHQILGVTKIHDAIEFKVTTGKAYQTEDNVQKLIDLGRGDLLSVSPLANPSKNPESPITWQQTEKRGVRIKSNLGEYITLKKEDGDE